jgi:hypothetical protein
VQYFHRRIGTMPDKKGVKELKTALPKCGISELEHMKK